MPQNAENGPLPARAERRSGFPRSDASYTFNLPPLPGRVLAARMVQECQGEGPQGEKRYSRLPPPNTIPVMARLVE